MFLFKQAFKNKVNNLWRVLKQLNNLKKLNNQKNRTCIQMRAEGYVW